MEKNTHDFFILFFPVKCNGNYLLTRKNQNENPKLIPNNNLTLSFMFRVVTLFFILFLWCDTFNVSHILVTVHWF